MSNESTFPERVKNIGIAREKFGTLIDRLGPALVRQDPLADNVVSRLALASGGMNLNSAINQALEGSPQASSEMLALVEEAKVMPVWVDESRLARAGQLLFRSGIPGGIALGAKSLLSSYTSPAGNKPLVWSGQLQSKIPRRLAETAKFVAAVAQPNGIKAGREGFLITLKVRLIHSQIRRLIHQRGQWPTERWGAPINQHDMVGAILLFSNAWLDGIEALGIQVTKEEAEDYMHLWRYVGHILGVEHDLLPATRAEGFRLGSIIELTQGPPDEDSRALVRAFLDHPLETAQTENERRAIAMRMNAYAGIVRYLLGASTADALGLPRDGWRLTAPAIREIVRRAELLRKTLPGGHELAIRAGKKHWSNVVKFGLAGIPAEFPLPQVLTGFRTA